MTEVRPPVPPLPFGDPGRQPARGGDIFSQFFQPAPAAPAGASPAGAPPAAAIRPRTTPIAPAASRLIPAPIAPTSLVESGLSLMQLAELILKHLYIQGNLVGGEISRQLRLPFQVVEEGLQFLKDEKCLEVNAGEVIGRVTYRFQLTDLGRTRAREAFEQCRYVGPAPVTLADYVQQCRRQTVAGLACNPDSLRDAFKEFVIRPGLLDELGPAVVSGRSIFVYGPPGNGKTLIAKGLGRYLNKYGGEIYVPYALSAENGIITLFDPTIHAPTDAAEQPGVEGGEGRLVSDTAPDWRWRRVKRPVVITGGELTLEMLDLRYNATANFYQAPLHVKANGGVFLIDDFGRQIVSPRDLLNRWIVPLEERIDYLNLATGKNFSVPFEQLIIFSTNLDPRELVDEAFLRRIRHKILIGPPSRELFTEIFQFACRQRQINYDQASVDYLFTTFYDQGKPPRASDSRDLLEIVQAICRFRNQEVVLNETLMAEATRRFFCQL